MLVFKSFFLYRHKYDSAIDINASAVAYLESMMAAAAGEFAIKEEKLVLNSITISAIKRVYDSPRAQEVLDMLQKYPVQIAPIVIKRLRQKGAQWKRKQVHHYYHDHSSLALSLTFFFCCSMSYYRYGENEMPRTITVHLIMQP